MHAQLLDIWIQTDQTVVSTTHSIDEAVTLADRVIVIGADLGTVQSTNSIETECPRERAFRKFLKYVARIRDKLGSPVDTDR